MKHAIALAALAAAAGASAGVQVQPAPRGRLTVSPQVLTQLRARYDQIPIATRPTERIVVRMIDPSKLNISGPQVDLRPTIDEYGLKIRDQGGRGTCSVFALTFCHEFMAAKKKGWKNLDFSEEYLNYVSNKVINAYKDGGFYHDLDKGYDEWGSYLEVRVPYKSSFDPNFKVSDPYLSAGKASIRHTPDFIRNWDSSKGASDAEVEEAIACLKAGIPVAGGFWWPKPGKFATADTLGVDLMTVPPKSDMTDGHSVDLVGYRKSTGFPGGGYFVIRNSWGADWGDKGYGYMPFSYVKAYCNDLLAYK
jgi:hypothetical protein